MARFRQCNYFGFESMSLDLGYLKTFFEKLRPDLGQGRKRICEDVKISENRGNFKSFQKCLKTLVEI